MQFPVDVFAFIQSWGISIGGTIIQNQLQRKLSDTILSQFPPGTSIVYSFVDVARSLSDSEKQDAVNAFAAAMQTFWQVLIGMAGMGLIASLFMKGLPLHTDIDKRYALRDLKRASRESGPDAHSAEGSP